MEVGDERHVAIVKEKPSKDGNLCLLTLLDKEDNQPIIKAAVDERGVTSMVKWCSPAWEKSYTWEDTGLVCQIGASTH